MPKIRRSKQEDCTKNIVKNYGRAICSFALSELAVPYLMPLIQRDDVNIVEFRRFIEDGRGHIDGISSFRRLLLGEHTEGPKITVFKKILQEIAVIFIKYFSVNWIYHGKLKNKSTHLMFRFKILRRVMNPEYFTYLKTFV